MKEKMIINLKFLHTYTKNPLIKYIFIMIVYIAFLLIPVFFFSADPLPKTSSLNTLPPINLISPKSNNSISKELNLYAKSAVLYDVNSQRFIYSKSSSEKLPMASTTKILTCIIALEEAYFDEIITVSSYAASMPDVQLNITKGSEYYLKDLLYSLMLESHNDVAAAIAEHIGCKLSGIDTSTITDNSYENSKKYIKVFTDLMTNKAKSLGCKNTCFETPNGLDSPNHYTTAEELAKIAAYAISNEKFITITNTNSYTFTDLNGTINHTVNNKNNFLKLYDGAFGCKTGFTSKAGYCFVGAAKQNDLTLISVVLASGWPPNKSYKWSDTISLMNYGFHNFTNKEVINSSFDIPKIKIIDKHYSTYISPIIKENISITLSETDTVTAVIIKPDFIKAPINKSDIVCYVQLYVNGILYKEIPAYSNINVEKKDFKIILKSFLNKYYFIYN